MKPIRSNQNSQLLRGGEQAVTRFRIVASPQMFKTLSSQLYTRKHEAIVREVSCNAVDAHVKAGCPEKPFLVVLPNATEPHLVIRDYGLGLSPEEVENVYTVYGESDKADSNDYVGYLGLGAKSPFAYTDHFQVTSWYQGFKYLYTATMASGFPEIAAQDVVASDEPSGLEVRIAVAKGDYSEFGDAAVNALRFFRVRPEVTGQDFAFKETEYATRNENYGLPTNNDKFVVMGDVGYPIDAATIGLAYKWNSGTVSGNDFEQMARNLLNSGLHLFLPIGAVEVAASREGLSYTPQTIDVVKKAVVAAATGVYNNSVAEVEKATNLWDAHKEANKQRAATGRLGSVREFTWRGKTVGGKINLKKHGFVTTAGTVKFKRYSWNNDTKDKWAVDKEVEFVTPSDAFKAVMVNDSTGHFAAARRYLNGAIAQVIIVSTQQLAAGILDDLGWVGPVVRVSEVPKPTPAIRVKGASVPKIKLRQLGYAEFGNADGVDPKVGGVYVTVLRNSVVWHGVAQPCGALVRQRYFLAKIGHEIKPVYGVIPSELDWLLSKGKWVHFHEAARAAVVKTTKTFVYGRTLVAAAASRDWHYRFEALLGKKFPHDSAFETYALLEREMYKAKMSDASCAWDSLNADYDVVKVVPDQAFLDAQDAVAKRYPLLFQVQRVRAIDVTDYVNYINLVDDAVANAATAARGDLKVSSN